jgi:hypothetical protein
MAGQPAVKVEVGPPGSSQVVTVKVADTTDGLAGLTATAELAEAEAARSANVASVMHSGDQPGACAV